MFWHYFALLLEWIFFIGLAGSLLVAVLAFVGDFHVFFEKDVDATHIASEERYSGSAAAD
jgi:hypothetical protein